MKGTRAVRCYKNIFATFIRSLCSQLPMLKDAAHRHGRRAEYENYVVMVNENTRMRHQDEGIGWHSEND